jgi:hypothetical protein
VELVILLLFNHTVNVVEEMGLLSCENDIR